MFSLKTALEVFSFSALLQVAASSDVFESLYKAPRSWTFACAAEGDKAVKFHLSLKQQNLDSFYDKLMDVSAPDHAQYGMHFEKHELRDMLKPTDESSNAAIS